MRYNPFTHTFEKGGSVLDLGAAFQGIWDAGTAYTKGQVVTNVGNLFVCLADHTNHVPPAPAWWEDITQRGPAGQPGDPGYLVSYSAGAILGGHRVVVLDGTSLAIHADPSTPNHAGRILGITTSAVGLGDPATIRTHGPITEPSWNWNTSLSVFLASNGQLTQTPPESGFLQVIGFPTAADTLFIQLQPPVFLF